MKFSALLASCVLCLLMSSSCSSTRDENIIFFKLADENLKIAEEQAAEPKLQEKYYLQALANYFKYVSLTDNSEASGTEIFELTPDDRETLIEAKIKAKKCIGILNDKFGRKCKFPDRHGQQQMTVD